MDKDQLIKELAPIIYNGDILNSISGQNAINESVMKYLNANYSKNDLENSNININIIMDRTVVNDIMSQSQGEIQTQYVYPE